MDYAKVCEKITHLKPNTHFENIGRFSEIFTEELYQACFEENGIHRKFYEKQKQKINDFLTDISKLNKPEHLFPKGIILLNIPSNESLESFVNAVFYSILSGNTVLIRPSKNNQKSVGMLWDKFNELVPNTSFCTYFDRDVLSQLISNNDVDCVYWTGGSHSASIIGEMCMKKGVSFEFDSEGNDWAYADESADQDLVIDVLFNSLTENNGFMCNSIKGLFIHKKIYKECKKRIKEEFNNRINEFYGEIPDSIDYLDSLLDNISCNEKLTYKKYVNIFFEPTHDISKSIFGPVCWVKPVESLDTVLDLYKQNKHGISFTLFTTDKRKYNDLLSKLKVSRLYINKDPLDVSLTDEWGGTKLSGNSGVKTWFEKFSYKCIIIQNLPEEYQDLE